MVEGDAQQKNIRSTSTPLLSHSPTHASLIFIYMHEFVVEYHGFEASVTFPIAERNT